MLSVALGPFMHSSAIGHPYGSREEPLWVADGDHLRKGAPIVDFAWAPRPLLDPPTGTASQCHSQISPDNGCRISYELANSSPRQFCSTALICPNGSYDFSAGSNIALEVGFGTQRNGDDFHTFTQLVILFYSDSQGFSNYFSSPAIAPGQLKHQKEVYVIRESEFAQIGWASWSAIKRVEVRLLRTTADGGPNYATVYRVWSFDGVTKVVFSFDDGDASIRQAVVERWFIPNKLNLSLGINSRSVGMAGKLSIDDLRCYHDEHGFDILNHTSTHQPLCLPLGASVSGAVVSYTSLIAPHQLSIGNRVFISGFPIPGLNGWKTVEAILSPSTFASSAPTFIAPMTSYGRGTMRPPGRTDIDLDLSITECDDWLTTNRFTLGRNLFIYPNGAYDYDTISRLRRLGFKSARTVRTGTRIGAVTAPGISAFSPDCIDLMALPAVVLSATSSVCNTALKIQSYVEDAIARGQSIFIYGHKIVPGATKSNEFDSAEFDSLMFYLLQQIEARRCNIMSYSEWVDSLSLAQSN